MGTVVNALKDAGLMAWEVWWALVLGFLISAIVALAARVVLPRRLEQRARRHAAHAHAGHTHRSATSRPRLRSLSAWSDVAHNFRGDLQMVWKEIAIGFLLAGFAAQLGNGAFTTLFAKGAPGPI